MTASVLAVTEAEYHADPCARPSLSHSIAHTLLSLSPAHAWLEHPRLGGGVERETTDAMDEGAVLHRLLLGAGADFEVVHAGDWRTKAAREQRDEISAAGRIAMLEDDFARLMAAAERIARNAKAQGFELGLPGSRSELAVEFIERVDGHEVLCRCRLDQVRADHVIYDLKRVRSAHPRDLARLIVSSGYDLQRAAYTRALEQLEPEALGRSDFVFLFCEVEPPYLVTPARLDGALRAVGEQRWERAVRLWHRCLSEGTWPWPGYSEGAVTLEAPGWVLSQELGEDIWQ